MRSLTSLQFTHRISRDKMLRVNFSMTTGSWCSCNAVSLPSYMATMSTQEWAAFVGGWGQAVEALVVVVGFVAAFRVYGTQKRAERLAQVADDLWAACWSIDDVIQQLNANPPQPHAGDWPSQRQMRSGVAGEALRNNTKAVARAALHFDDEQLMSEVSALHQIMFRVEERLVLPIEANDLNRSAELLARIRARLLPVARYKKTPKKKPPPKT